LHESLYQKHPEKWQSGDWFLHHDNAPGHTTLSIQQFSAKQNGGCVPPTHPTSLVATFVVSMDEAKFEREAFFLMLQRFNKNCWWPLTAFPLKILDNVASSGSSTGITASSHGRGLERGLKIQTHMNILNKFFVTIPEIFGSPLVHI